MPINFKILLISSLLFSVLSPAAEHEIPTEQEIEEIRNLVGEDEEFMEYFDPQNEGSALLMMAAYVGNLKVVKHLVSGAGFKEENLLVDSSELNVLHSAVKAKKYEIAKFLVESEHTEKLFACDDEGYTPFHLACYDKENEDIIKLFLNEQYSKYFKLFVQLDGDHDTHLNSIISWGDKKLIEYLLQNKSYMQELVKVQYEGLTPLSFAAWKGKIEIVIFLLESSYADYFLLPNNKGENALHGAVMKNENIEMVRWLFESKHASIFLKPNNKGKTALDYAICKNQFDMVNFLQKSGHFTGVQIVGNKRDRDSNSDNEEEENEHVIKKPKQ